MVGPCSLDVEKKPRGGITTTFLGTDTDGTMNHNGTMSSDTTTMYRTPDDRGDRYVNVVLFDRPGFQIRCVSNVSNRVSRLGPPTPEY